VSDSEDAHSEKNSDARLARGERTRQALLDAAFEEIHMNGYRAASLNDILKAAGCTKGSLYHHFPDKHSLGLAAIADNIDTFIRENWLKPLEQIENPIDAIQTIIGRHISGEIYADVRLGCPVQNLSQEMSGLDEDFRIYLQSIQDKWRDAIAAALVRGQTAGTVRLDLNTKATATMIIATHQGTIGLIKTAQNAEVGQTCGEALFRYLDSLRSNDASSSDGRSNEPQKPNTNKGQVS
jgi:TetR/AcrR family transcriptional regulator, transcriptional repressor for nem operon